MRVGWTLLALAALLLGASCDLVEDVQKTIEDFQALMPTGDPALGIPQLEPLSIRELPLSVKVTPFNAQILAKNILAAGASGFEVTHISLRDDGKLAVALNIPDIEVTGAYDIDGKVKVGFISVKLSGNGPLALSAVGIKGEGVAEVVERPNGGLHVNDLQISSWNYETLKVQLDNLFGGGVMGKTVNTLINKILPAFIKSNKEKINQLVQSKAKNFINKYLDGISGNKPSLDERIELITAEEWIISTETHEMLHQLAKLVAAEMADDSTSTPTPQEEQAMQILESFKAMMKDGRPDFSIPVLDPAVVHKLAIDANHALLTAKIIATDASVQGVSDFTVKKISQVGDTNKLVVDVAIPDIEISSRFEMRGKVYLPLPISVNDNGPLQLNITDLNLSATIEVINNSDGSYNIKSVTMDSWSFNTIKIQLDNLLGGGFWGRKANDLLNKILPVLVENDRPKINARLENVVKNLFNAYIDGLAGKTAADLTAQLQEISELFRSAMKSGRADINIPVMDPAAIDELSVQVEKWPIRAEVKLNSATVSGASDFKLTRVSQILGTNKVAVDFEVPSLVAACTYDLESTVHAAFIKFNVNRNGPLKMIVNGVSGTAIAELALTDDALSLLGLEVETWSYGSIEVEVDNLLSGGFFKRMFNRLVNKLIPGILVKPHVEDVRRWASGAGERIIGQFMDAVSGRVVLPNLDGRAAKLLEDLRSVLKTGSVKYDMPVYDPATVEQVPLEIKVVGQTARLVVKDITVHGTSDYEIAEITQLSNTNNLDIKIVVPALNANCKFTASTSGIIKLNDEGSASVNIKDLTVSATASMSSNIDGSLVLRDLKIRSWSTGAIAVTFENLDKLGKLGKALNLVINKVLPTIIEARKPVLTAWAQVTAKSVLDKFLTGVAADSLLPREIHIATIDHEAHAILMQLVNLALKAGLAA
ncbi:uncharacterized protein LOC127751071 [Frankliniella occidentalis]|uniref:Uncharacterized protein LOC127751071 n=1 Tax=Frankliniella occidentalis TaxID=133901 RepID=A0A9C6X6K7_FRAOC|nr:uncharacterized protein LOC127751071 [Frankliniella occidentalis]